jgi:hypothetical protein
MAQRAGIAMATHRIRANVESAVAEFARVESLPGPARRLDIAPLDPNDLRLPARTAPRAPMVLTPRTEQPGAAPSMVAADLPQIEDKPVALAAPALAAARLKENLTPALLKNFSLFLYVSTAPRGPLAQQLYVFRKSADGSLELLHDWAASTGRARYEISPLGRHVFTATPVGYYQFDAERMFRSYYSTTWNVPMPDTMFFNWESRGVKTGIAIHAAAGDDIDRLGRRASAGCIHLSPGHARELFDLIRAHYRGTVPRFAYDGETQTMSNRGALQRDADGRLEMADGYRVLTVIENFGGAKRFASLD